MDLLPHWISRLDEGFGNCENSLNVGKNEDSALPIMGHFGVSAGFETPTEAVGVDAKERAQVTFPVAVFLGDFEAVTLGRQVFCIWSFEGSRNIAQGTKPCNCKLEKQVRVTRQPFNP